MSRLALLTGASGFIAKHVAARLLGAGWRLRATVRSAARAEEVRTALGGVADTATLQANLDFVELDLNRDENWDRALAGADALVHTASPFPLSQPEDEDALIRPAVDGTLRALRAARDARVERVVLTSSLAAVMHCALPDGRQAYDARDWTDPAHPRATAYDRSKTLAERAAWDFVATEAPRMRLTTVNPGLVLGPLLDDRFGSSVAVVRRLMSGKDPMQPDFGLPVVDVRDVAEMHLQALERPGTAGQRYLASAGSLRFYEMARMLQDAHPDRGITPRRAPNLLMRLVALWDRDVRSILPSLGFMPQVSAAATEADMGIAFIRLEEALRATADDLLRRGLL